MQHGPLHTPPTKAMALQVMQCEHYRAASKEDRLEWELASSHTMLSKQWLDSKIKRRAVQPTVDVGRVCSAQLLCAEEEAELPSGPMHGDRMRCWFADDDDDWAGYGYMGRHCEDEYTSRPSRRSSNKMCFSWRFALVVTARRMCPVVPTIAELRMKLNARQPEGQPADVTAKRLWRLFQLMLFQRDHPCLAQSRPLFEMLVHNAGDLCPPWREPDGAQSKAQRLLVHAMKALVLPLDRAWLQSDAAASLWISVAGVASKLPTELHNSVLRMVEDCPRLPGAPCAGACSHRGSLRDTFAAWQSQYQ